MSRRLSQLGGTTTYADAAVAARLMVRPPGDSGRALAGYEQAFARATGTRHATSLATARLGILAVLRALGVGAGDEVVLQAPTHVVVANAIRRSGARPVYADCRPQDWNIDLGSARERITPRTRVLLVQHTFGIPVDPEAALALAAEHGLVLVEDCVHSLGASWAGRPAGAAGAAGVFSTEETKVISTTMGGMVVTSDPALHARVAAFRDACATPPRSLTNRYLLKLIAYQLLTQPRLHHWARAAYEALGERQPLPTPTDPAELAGGWRTDLERQLSAAQAVLGERQLARLAANLAHRRTIARRYGELLGDRPRLRLPDVDERADPSWIRFPVRVEDREAARRALRPHTVLGTWFTSVLEEADDPAVGGYEPGSCPVAEDAARHLINLPTHPRVTRRDAERIAAALGETGAGEL